MNHNLLLIFNSTTKFYLKANWGFSFNFQQNMNLELLFINMRTNLKILFKKIFQNMSFVILRQRNKQSHKHNCCTYHRRIYRSRHHTCSLCCFIVIQNLYSIKREQKLIRTHTRHNNFPDNVPSRLSMYTNFMHVFDIRMYNVKYTMPYTMP